ARNDDFLKLTLSRIIMTARDGKNVLLKVGNGATPAETFTTIGGLAITRLAVDNALRDASTLSSGAWRALNTTTGLQSRTLSGSGVFTDSAAEETVRSYAFANAVKNYELHFSNGDLVRGAFQMTHYERTGDIGDEERYTLTLESAGVMAWVPGA